MKIFIFFIFFIFFNIRVNSQIVEWVNSLGSTGSEIQSKICRDSNENYYVALRVSGTPLYSNFSTIVPITTPSIGSIYIAKYDKLGALIWVRNFGTVNGLFITSKIICDNNQNLVLCGYLTGSYTLGSFSYSTQGSNTDAIVFKFSKDGIPINVNSIPLINPSWVKNIALIGLQIDSLNNLYITSGNELISLDESLVQRYRLSLPSNYNMNDIFYTDNILYCIGSVKGTLVLQSDTNLAADSSFDIIVSAFNLNGTLKWNRRLGVSNTNEEGLFIRVINSRLLIVAKYNGSTLIGNQNLNETSGVNNNLIAFGDTSLSFYAINRIGSNGASVASLTNIVSTEQGLYLGGTFNNNIPFGNNIILKGASNGGLDFFITKLDTLANFLWAIDGNQTFSYISDLVADKKSNIVFSGWFSNTLNLINATRISRGSQDMFIAKILDISLRKDSLLEPAPYCAGDSISIRYSKRGTYNFGNTFYAQLSNRFGNYDSNTLIIGSRLDTASGIIHCKLPDNLSTSKLYQIRLYSDSPAVNSFPDTTAYLIYAQPKADAGTDTLLCRGQAAFIPNTSKADTFSWSPANLLIDARKKEVQSLPLNNRTSFVLKATIGVCSKYDTVTVTYRSRLRIVGSKDSTICDDDTITLQSFRAGGDSLGYSVQWYELGQNANWQLRAVDTNSYTVFNLPPGAPSQFAAVLTDGCTVIPDTAFIAVTTRDPLVFNLPTTQAICEGLSTSLQVQATGGIDTEYKFTWRNSIGSVLADTTILEINPATIADTLFIIQLTDGCSAPIADTIALTVSNKPKTSYSVDTTQGCQPLTVQFLYTGSQSAVNIFNWQFSDGQTSTIQNPQMVFPNVGVYGASLIVNNGCLDTVIQDSFITVFEQSQAAFTATPLEAELPNAVITFENKSLNSISYKWLLPNDQFDTVFEPELILKDTGLYQLVLIAKSKDGCLDTASQQVRVIEVFKLEIPNVFTPNGDGKNDTWNFEGTGYTVNEITLFNRWGTIVYNNNKPQVSWDGKDNNGKEITAGTYFYTLRLVTIDGITKELKGTVAVMR